MPPFEKTESVAKVGDLFKGQKNDKKVIFHSDDSKVQTYLILFMLGNFHVFCCHLLIFFSKSVKRVRSRSGLTEHWSPSTAKLFTKVISRCKSRCKELLFFKDSP